MLQAAGRMGGLVLEVENDTAKTGRFQPLEMRLSRAGEIRFDFASGVVGLVAIGHCSFSIR